MKKYSMIIWAIWLPMMVPLKAQDNYDHVLKQVETNSTTLNALRQQMEARKLENRTGIYLENPEVEFHYLWGSSPSVGNRTDITAIQSFDFPTVYKHKSRIAGDRNIILSYEYDSRKKALLLQAGIIYINIVYCHNLKNELDKRLLHARNIYTAYQERFDRGDADILERNKTRLNLLNAQKASEANLINLEAYMAELQRLNGGIPVEMKDTLYPSYIIPDDFNAWYEYARQNNPDLLSMDKEIEASRRKEKLSKAMSLPKFSAGYMSEGMTGDFHQGMIVGMSIPLWENKNTIRQAKAQTVALQNMKDDSALQFYNMLLIQHTRVVSLQRMVEDYRSLLESTNNSDLLKKALDMGNLSMINYIMELTIYYEAIDQLLQAERDSWRAAVELRQWETDL